MRPALDSWQPRESAASVAAAGLIALAVAMGIGRFAFTPILPMMQDDAGLSIARGSWLASANYVGYFLGALWATVHRVRSPLAIRAALLVIGLATLAMGLVEQFAAWLVLRMLAGVASAWALIHVSAWCLERLTSLRRPLLIGVVFTGVGSGIALAGGMCLALMSIRASSWLAWASLGMVSLVVAALIWPVVDEGAAPTKRGRTGAGRRQWTPRMLQLVFSYGAFGFGYIIPATFVPVMAKQAIADPALFGWAWPVFGLTAAASTLLSAVWSRAGAYRRVWIVASAAMAAGVAAPVALPGLPGVLMAAVGVGGTFMVITMAGMQEAGRVAGAAAPALIGAMTAAFALGQIIGPLTAGLASDLWISHLIASALLVLSAVVLAIEPDERSSRG